MEDSSLNQTTEMTHLEKYTNFFDLRFQKSREYLVFMEESKLYQRMLENCTLKAGPDAPARCRELVHLVKERVEYYNSKYRQGKRPTLSPGLPKEFEKRE